MNIPHLTKPFKVFKLASYELEDFWQEGLDESIQENQVGTTPAMRWFKSYDVYLTMVTSEKKGMSRSLVDKVTHKPDISQKWFTHFVVCSPSMKTNPPETLEDEIASAHVQNIFDQDSAFDYLNNRIEQVDAERESDLEVKLAEFLYILPKKRK